MARGFNTSGDPGGTHVANTAFPVQNGQTNFGDAPTWLYVVDNNGRQFLINHETRTRIPVTGSGQAQAMQALFGSPLQGVYLTGYQEQSSVVDFFGGPNGIEQVVAGQGVNPLTGKVVDNPQAIQGANNEWFTPPETAPDTGVPETSGPPEEQDDEGPSQDTIAQVKSELTWMPEELLQIYMDEWVQHESDQRALNAMRQSEAYEKHFPGNLREDGTVIHPESDYMAQIDSFRNTVSDFGIPADAFEHRYPELIQEGVSAGEFRARVQRRWNQLAQSGEFIRQFYADQFGTGDISDRALLASFMDPDTNPVEWQQQFRTSVVGGTAERFGFDIALSEAETMSDFLGGQEAAQQFFSRAQGFLPTLGSLVERHDDPDDEFELDEFFDAVVIGDSEQRERIARLLAQEAASFSPVAPRNLRPR